MTGNEVPTNVLVVEDEVPMRKFVRVALGSQGWQVTECETGREALTLTATNNPDAILLDLGLPDMDGLDVVRQLREWTAIPIIVVSARGREKDKIDALDLGADDYLTKPFGAGELLARVRVALRHSASLSCEPEAIFRTGGLKVDLLKRVVFVSDQEVHLTPIEYKLLVTLIRHAGMVLTHRQLLKEAWGGAYVEQTHYLRVFMSQLRRKIEADPARPQLILNEPGVGYRLKID